MNFFKTKQRTPPDLIRGIRDAIPRLESGAPGSETRRRVRLPLSFSSVSPSDLITPSSLQSRQMRNVQRIYSRSRLYSMATAVRCYRPQRTTLTVLDLLHSDPLPEVVAQLAQETYNTDLLHYLVQNIARFEFESRKDVVQIFNNLLRRQIGTRWPTVEYLSGKPEVIFSTLAGYENEEIALNTGMILKEMLRHEQLAKTLLHSDK